VKKLFVFDLDDTLIDNVHDYTEPILDACKLIVQALGNKAPHVSKIIAIEQEIDTKRVNEINPTTGRPYFWSMERFPTSLIETYREICKQVKVEPEGKIEDMLYGIGLKAFDETRYIKNINPQALSVLTFLKEKKDVLLLCSKGDMRVQEKKVAALKEAGIDQFSSIYIVDQKTSEVFSKISEGFNSYNLYSVGNSYSSDILPAIQIGFTGIYIPVETWETIGQMDKIFSEVDQEKCILLENLGQIKTRYRRLK